jgi:hypothetical protein
MRREPSFFQDQEVELVYIGRKLAEALAFEDLLTSFEVEYLVQPEEFFDGVIFHRARMGAFFYVPRERASGTRELMERNGYRPYCGPE